MDMFLSFFNAYFAPLQTKSAFLQTLKRSEGGFGDWHVGELHGNLAFYLPACLTPSLLVAVLQKQA